MARKLTPQEYFAELSQRWGCSEENAKRMWHELVDFFCDELLIYGFVELPNMGNLKTVTRKGKYAYLPVDKTKLKDGETPEKVWVEPYQQIRFTPSSTMKQYINGDKATKAQTLRQREIYRKLQKEEIEREKQFAFMQNAQDIMAEVRRKHAESEQKRKAREKVYKRASKKQKAIMDNEAKSQNNKNDYWDLEE